MAKKKQTSNALVKWEEQFAELAKEDAKNVSVSEGSKFLSFKNGDLSFEGEQIEDNELTMIIVGWSYVNTYYDPDIKYDAKNPSPPICYAFGRDEASMEPMAQAPEKQCDSCAECPLNRYGSGAGDSKACKNGVRIAFIASDDIEDIAEAEVIFAQIPPTSLRNWNMYLTKTLRDKCKRPCWSVVTTLRVEKDDESTFKVYFELAEDGLLTDVELFTPLLEKYDSCTNSIAAPFPVLEKVKKPAAKTTAKTVKGKYRAK